MKTKILAIVLLFASFTFAQLSQANDTKKQTIDKTDFHARSGLYFSTGLTFGYEFLNNRAIEDYDEYHSTQKFLFDAWLIPFIEVRLGGYISNSVSFYGSFGIGFEKGVFEDSLHTDTGGWDKTTSATSMRMHFGLGAEFYPFKNKENPLSGLFFGLCNGLALEYVTFPPDFLYSSSTFDNIFTRIETGYEWWFSTHWRIGVTINYTFGGFIETDPGFYDDATLITKSHTFGLTIRLTH